MTQCPNLPDLILPGKQLDLAYVMLGLKGGFATHVELAKCNERRRKPQEGFA